MSSIRVCAVLFALVTACAGSESAKTDSVPAPTADRAAKAAAVSNAIAANPAGADSILKANGFTQEQFQKEMYEIAEDSALSAEYAAARSK